MQPLRQLISALHALATPASCLFTPADLRSLLPFQSDLAFKTLLSRAAAEGYLERVCRGLYFFPIRDANTGFVLHRTVTKLRPLHLNYLSLETVLSDAGVISQVLIQRLTVMSSGRTSTIECGRWGSIEFVHTRQKHDALLGQLVFDSQCQLWRATIPQAIRDMKAARRGLDLIDWSMANASV